MAHPLEAIVVHRVFIKAWNNAFASDRGDPADQPIDVDNAGEADYQMILSRRVRKATQFVNCEENLMAALGTALLTEPLDAFTLVCLRRDEEGGLLRDMYSLSPAVKSQTDVCGLTCGDAYALVQTHFPTEGQRFEYMCESMRALALELASALHYRIGMYFGRYPHQLLCLSSDALTHQQRLAVARAFYDNARVLLRCALFVASASLGADA